jgi:hypothetical protein
VLHHRLPPGGEGRVRHGWQDANPRMLKHACPDSNGEGALQGEVV